MTHDELILLIEAATAGWHGAKARDEMLGLVTRTNSSEQDIWAIYHARLSARAALRCLAAVEEW